MQSRVHQLEGDLADASEAASSIREELAGQADDQLQLALRQQALKYERQIQVSAAATSAKCIFHLKAGSPLM
jgi:hypothetical protein